MHHLSIKKSLLCVLVILGLIATGYAQSAAATDQNSITVFAAASVSTAMESLAKKYEQMHQVKVILNTASSSVLARQIEAGAKADVFISADQQWMDYLTKKSLIVRNSRCDLMASELVLIASVNKPFKVEMRKGFDIAVAFGGRLAIGEPCTVPVGRYAFQALKSLDWYDSLYNRLVPCESARSVLTMVERGEVAAGIVYKSEVVISKKVVPVAVFPANTHNQICYPVAAIKDASPETVDFIIFLQSKYARDIFSHYGFSAIKTFPDPNVEHCNAKS